MTKKEKLDFLAGKLKSCGAENLLGTLKQRAKNQTEYFYRIYEIVADKRWKTYGKEQEKKELTILVESESEAEASRKAGISIITDAISEMVSKRFGVPTEQERETLEQGVDEIAKQSFKTKISFLFQCANKLQLYKENPTELFDTLETLYKENRLYFDMMVHAVHHIFKDEHYKECDCPLKKFKTLLASTSMKQAASSFAKQMKQEHDEH